MPNEIAARRVCTVAALLLLAGAASSAAQGPHRDQLAARFQAQLQRLADDAAGVAGIAVVDLSGGRKFGVNDQLVFPQGSAIKIPILIELFRRADAKDLRLDERVAVRSADQVGGSGLIQHFANGGSELSLHDLAVAMIVLSDNTATNLVIDRLGMARVTQTMKDLGAGETRLQRKMIRPEESARGNENLSTPREAAAIMERIARCSLPMSPAACESLRRILEIPKQGAFREPIPPSLAVAWKPGGIEGVETAWGLVPLPGAPYAIAVMVNYGGENVAQTLRDVSAATYRYFSQIARTTPHGARVPIEHLRKPGGSR